jgi:hypothetical protein
VRLGLKVLSLLEELKEVLKKFSRNKVDILLKKTFHLIFELNASKKLKIRRFALQNQNQN